MTFLKQSRMGLRISATIVILWHGCSGKRRSNTGFVAGRVASLRRRIVSLGEKTLGIPQGGLERQEEAPPNEAVHLPLSRPSRRWAGGEPTYPERGVAAVAEATGGARQVQEGNTFL